MLFDRASAVLTDQTKADLDAIAEVIRGHRNIVMVKGHTSLDDLPTGATDQQKMDLSIRRAQAAAGLSHPERRRGRHDPRSGLLDLRTAHSAASTPPIPKRSIAASR